MIVHVIFLFVFLQIHSTLFVDMTAQLLPSFVLNPFEKHFGTRSYPFNNCTKQNPSFSGSPPTSIPILPFEQKRQFSPTSIYSHKSAQLHKNNENEDVDRSEEYSNPSSFESVLADQVSNQLPSTHINACCLRDTFQDQVAISSINGPASGWLSESECTRKPANSLAKSKTDKSYLRNPNSPEEVQEQTVLHRAVDDSLNIKQPNLDQPHNPKAQGSTPTAAVGEVKNQDGISTSGQPSHRKRASISSSKFVHTIKTASMSRASLSLISRSLHQVRSREKHGGSTSHERYSIDSERPPTLTSLDDMAIRRGFRRRQILDELVITEESYVMDLKALEYLYCTLPASTMTISRRVQSSTLQNVRELLSIHEFLLEELHKAALRSAARKWAETISPRRLGDSTHRRWKSLDSAVGPKQRRHKQTRSSGDSSTKAVIDASNADPEDISDIAKLFNSIIGQFFAYEEYCANQEIVACELQKQLHNTWSTFESGIESLARSITSLEKKDQNKRKGFTVADLLISPIQRICRYPLLFDDLLKQTPVADCPVAHTDIETVLQCLRCVVNSVNIATGDFQARTEVRRRWSLVSRLSLEKSPFQSEHFRRFGSMILCGVLHITFQTKHRIDGQYSLCVLFEDSFLIAMPVGKSDRFEIIAFIALADLTLESASNGKGKTPKIMIWIS